MRRISILLGIAVVPLALITSSTSGRPALNPRPQGQIVAGTDKGALEVRVALPEFPSRSGDDVAVKMTALLNQVIWSDLEYSGNITLVSRSFLPIGRFQQPGDIKIEDWTRSGVNAQYLVFGNTLTANGRLSVEARLWDLAVPQNRELIGQRYSSELTEGGVRLLAHKISDDIVNKLFGGNVGIAQTKLAFVADRASSSSKQTSREIYVMDYDGANPYPLTAYQSISVTPSWSPDGEKIAFTTYRKGIANIEILSRLDRRPYPFPTVGGTTATPAWSPDGSRIAFATSKDGSDTEIYVADWNGFNMKRLTISKGVDISPVWNPRTGREIAFVSDRSGSPQIYIMDDEGTNVRRIINDGGDAVNPAWSPDGQNIAFAWQRPGSGQFNIYIHNLATGNSLQLTQDQRNNEKPSWAPDGRHLVFESNRTGTLQIYTMLADGRMVRQLTTAGRNLAPAWSGFIEK
jgi:TolB protein